MVGLFQFSYDRTISRPSESALVDERVYRIIQPIVITPRDLVCAYFRKRGEKEGVRGVGKIYERSKYDSILVEVKKKIFDCRGIANRPSRNKKNATIWKREGRNSFDTCALSNPSAFRRYLICLEIQIH